MRRSRGLSYWVGMGDPAQRKNQTVRASIASITEAISTASTTVTELRIGAVSRMLFSQPGRIGSRRLVPVIRMDRLLRRPISQATKRMEARAPTGTIEEGPPLGNWVSDSFEAM